ncbi:MAG: ABC transporter substrate-binding protein [Ilumatobacteraceae bacterium]
MKRKSRIAALMALSLIAIACSDDKDADSPNTSDTAAPTSTGDSTSDTTAPTGETRTLKIGYAYQDVSAFTILSDKFSLGDIELQAQSVLEGWRRDGLLPAGIDIELVFAKFNTLNPDDMLGACTKFAQDDEIFAAIASRDFPVGSTCLAERFGIPIITSMGLSTSDYERGAPWLFSVQPTQSQAILSFVEWANERGALEGKRVGIYWDTRSEEAADDLKAALAELGVEVVSDLPSDGEGIGSPQDAILVPRFIEDGVDFPILMVGTSSMTAFLDGANTQGYSPDLLWFEWASHLNDVSTDALPQDLIDGVQAMTFSRVGELAAGIEPSAAAATCIENYESYAGEDVDLSVPVTAATGQLLFTCDLMAILLEGLRNAGGADITPESFAASLEMITDLEMAWWGNVSYSADDHAGVDQVRTITWTTECGCWTAEGEFATISLS